MSVGNVVYWVFEPGLIWSAFEEADLENPDRVVGGVFVPNRTCIEVTFALCDQDCSIGLGPENFPDLVLDFISGQFNR